MCAEKKDMRESLFNFIAKFKITCKCAYCPGTYSIPKRTMYQNIYKYKVSHMRSQGTCIFKNGITNPQRFIPLSSFFNACAYYYSAFARYKDITLVLSPSAQ